MIDTILEYVADYLPALLMLVMMFIDRFGFGNLFSAFRKDVLDAFNVKTITASIDKLRDDLKSVLAENEELRKEIIEVKEALRKVKGGKRKNEQRDAWVQEKV